jgi:hypothetical protein
MQRNLIFSPLLQFCQLILALVALVLAPLKILASLGTSVPSWEIQFCKQKTEIVSTEIDKLLMKGAIKEVDAVEDQFISNLFLVPSKKNAKKF